jgi:hypothetical protein
MSDKDELVKVETTEVVTEVSNDGDKEVTTTTETTETSKKE